MSSCIAGLRRAYWKGGHYSRMQQLIDASIQAQFWPVRRNGDQGLTPRDGRRQMDRTLEAEHASHCEEDRLVANEVESRECLPAPWARLTRLVPATRCRRKSGY
jgi:hypothetical protein